MTVIPAGLPMFYDLENCTLNWLKATFAGLADPGPELVDHHVGTETPPDLQDRFPFVRVTLGAGRASASEQIADLEVEVFDSTRAGAYALTEAIREGFLSPLLILAGARIDNVENQISPRRLPWDETGTVRFSAEYRLVVRRR